MPTATKTKKAKKSQVIEDTREADEMPTHPLARCRPLADRVVVRREAVSKVTQGGIVLPESTLSQHKQQTGTVWSVGPGRTTDGGVVVPVGVAKGQKVIITGWAGLEIKDAAVAGGRDDEFVMLREEDILAILEE